MSAMEALIIGVGGGLAISALLQFVIWKANREEKLKSKNDTL